MPRFPLHSPPRIALLILAVAISAGARAENIDPGENDSQYAWSENAGWINLEPQGNGGPGVQVDAAGLTGWMWSENTGWISLSCSNTSSCGTVSYGVTNDGQGTLAGYAWAENVGWISFSCANTGTCGAAAYGVSIDPVTGAFAGEAWSENMGWIRFVSSGANPFSIVTGWTCGAPSAPLTLTAAKMGADLELSWSAVPGATGYDVVQGDLGTLRAGGGGFTAATMACPADDQAATMLSVAGDPAPGGGFWWLSRPVGCSAGSYDSGAAQQAAPRDAAIAAAPAACP